MTEELTTVNGTLEIKRKNFEQEIVISRCLPYIRYDQVTQSWKQATIVIIILYIIVKITVSDGVSVMLVN